MKQPKTGLLDGETLIRSGGGYPVTFFTGFGGSLFLTNKRIFHESLIGGKMTTSIDLSNMAEIKKVRYSHILCMIPFMKAVKVFIKDGTSTMFHVSDKDGWMVAIQQAIKG